MLKHALLAMFGAVVGLAIAVSSAQAADDVEAKAQVCAGCHGESGVPADAKTMPPIWGQQVSYLTKQLHDYKSGDRKNAIMSQIAGGLEQQDLRPIAAYFAAKTWPAKPASAPAAPASAPEGLALCQACHQKNFEGGAPAPRLAGLSYEYLVASMNAFAKGERTNNQDMPKIMQTLTESQRDAMAKYLSQL